jgi:hypothetical protein
MKKITTLFLLFYFAFGQRSIAQYSWNNVGLGVNLPVETLVADSTNNKLYAGGLFILAGGSPALNVAEWNGAAWSPLGSGILSGTGVSSLLVDGTDLIAGGSFLNIGGVLSNNVAKWNGSIWASLGLGLTSIGPTSVNTLAKYNSELYAGGIFTTSGVSLLSNIAKWDGVSWQSLGSGVNGPVKSMCVYNGELYVGGTFTLAGGVAVNNIAKWDGTNWSDVGGGVFYTGATTVSTLQVYSNVLYAGGTFTSAGSALVNNIAKWDGSTWSDVNGGARYTGATTVSTMSLYQNTLVVGGLFDSLGTISANNIGYWDGVTWGTFDTGTDLAVQASAVLTDTLYAGGLFTTAGGNLTPFVAEWTPESSSVVLSDNNRELNPSVLPYPNPVSEKLLIKFSEGFDKNNCAFKLFDLLGKEILNTHLSEEINFDRKNISSGLYIYRITDGNQILSQGKLSFK